MSKVVDGTVIEYVREDAGGLLNWQDPMSGGLCGWVWKRGEQVVAGRDVPTDLCARSVEDGICRVVEPAAPVVSEAVADPSPVADGPAKGKAKNTDPAQS